MAQITLTDYLTLHDGSFTIGSWKEFSFRLPSDFVKGTNKAKPILQFMLYASKDSRLAITINNDTVSNPVQFNKIVHQHQHWRSMHELIDGSKFIPGETNVIAFHTIGVPEDDFNEVGISDVVLTFQRKIQI